jgi:hypothetical protein
MTDAIPTPDDASAGPTTGPGQQVRPGAVIDNESPVFLGDGGIFKSDFCTSAKKRNVDSFKNFWP